MTGAAFRPTALMAGLVLFSWSFTLNAQNAELAIEPLNGGWRLALTDGQFAHVTANAIEEARLIESAGAPAAIAWRERLETGKTAGFYALRKPGGDWTRVRQAATALKLRYAEFDPLISQPQAVDLTADEGRNDLYIVQFHTPPLEAYREDIRNLGGVIRRFLPNQAHLVEMGPSARQAAADLPHVRWIGAYEPAFRLENYLLDNLDRAQTLFPRQRYVIQVMDAGLVYKEAVASRLRSIGADGVWANAGKFLLEADLTPTQLTRAANWNEVLFIDRWTPIEEDMDIVRQIGGADFIETMEGFTGQGVRGEVLDSGFNITHVDFSSRPLIQHTTPTTASHGAATSGIVFGDGTGNAAARGLLPSGQGIIASSSFVFVGPGRYTHTGELLDAPYFAVFQTASVGSSRTLFYSNISSDTDAALFDFDVLHTQSQSNALERFSRPQAWAKNIVSVGGVRHFNTLDKSDDCWGCGGGGGSIGPATDGRIKPDLSHFYDNTFTVTSPGTTAYGNFGGTSGATPIVAGHFGLFFQMWHEGLFGNTVDPDGTVFENRPHHSTAKAMMINAASQYAFEGEAHDLARTHQGWGFPDLRNLYDLRDDFFIIDESDVIAPLETKVYRLDVAPGAGEFRATMVYLDPPGTPGATQARVNDLSLRVTSPDGQSFWGNNGLLNNNFSTTGGVSNDLDTVENVWVQNPVAGVWTVEVIADEINQDGHVETGALDADFALVVSPASPAASSPALQILLADDIPAETEANAPFDVRIRVLDGAQSLMGAPTLHYRFDSVDPFTQLAMTDQGGGVFSATVPGAACGATAELYFSAQGDGGGTAAYPLNAPTAVVSVEVFSETVLIFHDFESDQGWTAGAPDDDATTGAWERATPLARSIQPLFDHTPDPGTQAFVTGNEQDNQSVGANDVDNGKTTLFSPIFDLTGEEDAIIGYYRWYANYLSAQDDVFLVDISTDGGGSWTNVETVGPTGSGVNGGWVYSEFRIGDVIAPTNQVQLRFTAADLNDGSLLEAAIDDFVIYRDNCDCSEALFFSQLPQWPQISVLDLLTTIIDCNLSISP